MKRQSKNLNHSSKTRISNKNIKKKMAERERKKEMRRIQLIAAMAPENKFPVDNLIHFQAQPLGEDCSVCALIAYGHILGKEQDIDKREHFHKIGNELAEKQLKDKLTRPGEGFYTENGHFHMDVLHCALQRSGYSVFRVHYDTCTMEKNTPERYQLFVNAIMASKANIFLFMNTIILTKGQATVAQKHYSVIRKVDGHTTPVLLDGFFSYPMIVCEAVLGRYIELGNLYEVFN